MHLNLQPCEVTKRHLQFYSVIPYELIALTSMPRHRVLLVYSNPKYYQLLLYQASGTCKGKNTTGREQTGISFSTRFPVRTKMDQGKGRSTCTPVSLTRRSLSSILLRPLPEHTSKNTVATATPIVSMAGRHSTAFTCHKGRAPKSVQGQAAGHLTNQALQPHPPQKHSCKMHCSEKNKSHNGLCNIRPLSPIMIDVKIKKKCFSCKSPHFLQNRNFALFRIKPHKDNCYYRSHICPSALKTLTPFIWAGLNTKLNFVAQYQRNYNNRLVVWASWYILAKI